jgi:hypothetical protein
MLHKMLLIGKLTKKLSFSVSESSFSVVIVPSPSENAIKFIVFAGFKKIHFIYFSCLQ